MDAVKRRDPPVQLDGHVGLHIPAIPHPTAERLHWTRMHPPYEHARVKKNTCEQCAGRSYELLQRGGQYLIRRTDRARSAPVIHETPSVPHLMAEDWWEALIHGMAY